MHLCLDKNSDLLYVITNRSFRPRRMVTGRRTLAFLHLTWPSTVVVPRTSCRDDSVVCCHSAVPLRPSCSERRMKTIQLPAVVQAFRYGCHDSFSDRVATLDYATLLCPLYFTVICWSRSSHVYPVSYSEP